MRDWELVPNRRRVRLAPPAPSETRSPIVSRFEASPITSPLLCRRRNRRDRGPPPHVRRVAPFFGIGCQLSTAEASYISDAAARLRRRSSAISDRPPVIGFDPLRGSGFQVERGNRRSAANPAPPSAATQEKVLRDLRGTLAPVMRYARSACRACGYRERRPRCDDRIYVLRRWGRW